MAPITAPATSKDTTPLDRPRSDTVPPFALREEDHIRGSVVEASTALGLVVPHVTDFLAKYGGAESAAFTRALWGKRERRGPLGDQHGRGRDQPGAPPDEAPPHAE